MLFLLLNLMTISAVEDSFHSQKKPFMALASQYPSTPQPGDLIETPSSAAHQTFIISNNSKGSQQFCLRHTSRIGFRSAGEPVEECSQKIVGKTEINTSGG